MWYVFEHPNGQLIGVDNSSGGYPSKTDYPGSAKYWRSVEEAEEYRGIFTRSPNTPSYYLDAGQWILKTIKIIGINTYV